MVMSPGYGVPGEPATPPSEYECPNDGAPLRAADDGTMSCPVCGTVFEADELKPRRTGRRRR